MRDRGTTTAPINGEGPENMCKERILVIVAVGVALAIVAPVQAQIASNDVGVSVQSNGKPLLGGALPGLAPPACQVATAFSGANSQLGRIFRDAVPSSCPSKAYPGIFNPATSYFFETFTYTNTAGVTNCVTINFDPNTGATPCTTNAHASAYLTSYDPMNQATNFVGDVGSSITDSFSVDVPAATDLIIVVTNTAAEQICNFAFEAVNIACVNVDADLQLDKTVAPPSVLVGGNVVFTLTVTNNGPNAATNVQVTDTLPPGLSYVSDDCGGIFVDPTLTWTVGPLANGAMATCNVTVQVNALGAQVNDATVSANTNDPTPANNTSAATVGGQSILEVPAISPLGAAVLVLLLVGAGVVLVARRRRRSID